MGYVIILEFSLVVAVSTCCFSPFWLNLLVAGDRSTVTGVTPLFIQQTLARGSVFAIVFGRFSRIKNARPNCDAISQEDVGLLSVDTNSLRHLPRRSSKKCDLQFENSDRLKENS